jgi:hypothetical protein
MVLKVHGGLINDQFLTGSLNHYSVVGADFSNAISDGNFVIPDGAGPGIDLVIGEGQPVPDSAAAIIMNEVAKKATVVITNPTDQGLYFALENDDNDWTLSELETMIRTLGTVGVDGVDVSNIAVVGTAYVLFQGNPSGVHRFIELLDTEDSYDGYAGYHLAVNSAEDGVIFVPDDSGSSSLVELSDTSETPVADGYLRWDSTGSEVIYEDSISSSNISVDSSAFDGNLSPTDDTLQKALETVDDLSLSLPSGLTVTVINGQPTLTLIDSTRGDKVLSVSENCFVLSERRLGNNDWVKIGEANSSRSSIIADFDGTVVGITVHCENTSGNEKDIRLWIEDTEVGDIASINSLSGNIDATFVDTNLNYDFSQGDRIRLRCGDNGGNIQDTVIKLTVKWRA